MQGMDPDLHRDVWNEGFEEGYGEAVLTLSRTARAIQDEADEARAECTRLYDQIQVLRMQLQLETPEGRED